VRNALAGLSDIRSFVVAVSTGEPGTLTGSEQFRYIDIASIDREQKVITNTSLLNIDEAPSRARQLVKAGDVLVSTVRPNLNAVAVVPDELDGAIASTGFCVLRVEPRLASNRYVFHWVRTSQFVNEMSRLATGASYPAVSDRIILNSKIPAHLVKEQQRIAAILDKADAIRRKRRETVEIAKVFSHALFAAMFARGINASAHGQPPMHWYSSTVDQIKATRQYSCVGGPFGSDLTANDYVNEPGIPVIRGLNLSDDSPYMNEDGFVFVSEDKAKELSKCAAFRGDIIVSQRGARLAGQVGLIAEDSRFPVYLVSQSQMKITVNLSTIDPIFLVYYLQSAWAVREIERRMMSTGVPHINLGILKSFPVYIPPMELQHKFQSVWSKHRILLASFSNGLSESERLFESLVQRAFRGEL